MIAFLKVVQQDRLVLPSQSSTCSPLLGMTSCNPVQATIALPASVLPYHELLLVMI